MKARHLLFAALFWILVFTLADCGSEPPAPEQLATTTSALTTAACNPSGGFPGRSVEVTYSLGTCIRYTMPSAPLNQQNYVTFDQSLGSVFSVRTASNAAAWVCDSPLPRGTLDGNGDGHADAPWAPCWNGGVNNGFQRIRGPWLPTPGIYAAYAANIATITGRSFVLTLGTLPTPPSCNSMTALHWHQFGAEGYPHAGDDGTDAYTGNNDPADGPGSPVTTTWPYAPSGPGPGPTGSPCHTNAAPSGYAEVYYTAF